MLIRLRSRPRRTVDLETLKTRLRAHLDELDSHDAPAVVWVVLEAMAAALADYVALRAQLQAEEHGR